jgi:hypothetical protein
MFLWVQKPHQYLTHSPYMKGSGSTWIRNPWRTTTVPVRRHGQETVVWNIAVCMPTGHTDLIILQKHMLGLVEQLKWWRTYLASVKPWTQTPVPPKKKKKSESMLAPVYNRELKLRKRSLDYLIATFFTKLSNLKMSYIFLLVKKPKCLILLTSPVLRVLVSNT